MSKDKSNSAAQGVNSTGTELSESDSLSETSAVLMLSEGKITECRSVPRGSNYVYLLSLQRDDESAHAIYKPRKGEAPLWDFPDGTLYLRERAAYLVSEALKWHLIPTTVIREGPYGIGIIQRFVNTRETTDYSKLFENKTADFRRIAVFDWLVNNADRKVGHCLEAEDGRLWFIDHGLTFHEVPKLRTVIWDFAGQPVPRELLDDMEGLSEKLKKHDELEGSLSELLSRSEIQALKGRLAGILNNSVYPTSFGSNRRTPWPPY